VQELFHYHLVDMTHKLEQSQREADAQRDRMLAEVRAAKSGRAQTRERRPSRFGLARLLPSL
jgi:hypothetical protein